MGIAIRAAVLVAVSLCIVACEASGRGSALPEQGVSYRGPVVAQILEPGRAPGAKATGAGRAELADLGGGRSRLTVEASIRKPGDAGFSLDGRRIGTTWSGASETLRLEIDGNGNISGGGTADNMRVVFGGRATRELIDLRVELESLALSRTGVFPVGTRTVFDYTLERARATLPATAKTKASGDTTDANVKDAQGRECRTIVWTMRNVAAPGGGMTMIQVPHCVR